MSNYIPQLVHYICVGMHRHKFSAQAEAPPGGENWPVHSNEGWKRRCPHCGSFGVPAVLWKPGSALDRHFYFMFAACPNAYTCSGYDMYAGDCEEGRVIPKCFHSIHARLDALEDSGRSGAGADQ